MDFYFFNELCGVTVLFIFSDHIQFIGSYVLLAQSAAAKLLQSCPTLTDPIDGNLPGSSVPGILTAEGDRSHEIKR